MKASSPASWRERTALAALVSTGFVLFLWTLCAGLHNVFLRLLALVLAVAVAVAAFLVTRRALPASIDGSARRHPVLTICFAISALLAVGQIGRLSVFMVDSSQRWGTSFPLPRLTDHACLPAYLHAAELVRDGEPNPYAVEHYPIFFETPDTAVPPPPTRVEHLRPWLRDAYEYPPPFLLFPRAALVLSNDYAVIRTVWFGLHGALALLFVLSLARYIGGAAGLRAGMLTPLLFASLPIMLILQWGQAHLLVIGASIMAMISFAKGRTVAGALLLGLASWTKIFPGVLVLYLFLRGQRRAAVATAGVMVLLALLALAVLGAAPLVAFVHYQLPRMSSGAAFSFLQRDVLVVARNLSISGVVFKLHALGLGEGILRAAPAIGWLYTFVVIGVAIWAARRTGDRLAEASTWLGLLALGSLRSPFAPSVYAVAPVLWLLTLRPTRDGRSVAVLAISWLLVMGLPPFKSARVELVLSFFSQALVVFCALRGVCKRDCS